MVEVKRAKNVDVNTRAKIVDTQSIK